MVEREPAIRHIGRAPSKECRPRTGWPHPRLTPCGGRGWGVGVLNEKQPSGTLAGHHPKAAQEGVASPKINALGRAGVGMGGVEGEAAIRYIGWAPSKESRPRTGWPHPKLAPWG